ncbi:proline-rich protein 2-like [Sceloporus undulatus]|uniref:proline-rich protein 2-like n=1 Tax=Sceloporus undulatus TaxID=8520 RepID=UPI001C4D9441|nr:proline-rich protein 2-like [Sceloporus undulatus]
MRGDPRYQLWDGPPSGLPLVPPGIPEPHRAGEHAAVREDVGKCPRTRSPLARLQHQFQQPLATKEQRAATIGIRVYAPLATQRLPRPDRNGATRTRRSSRRSSSRSSWSFKGPSKTPLPGTAQHHARSSPVRLSGSSPQESRRPLLPGAVPQMRTAKNHRAGGRPPPGRRNSSRRAALPCQRPRPVRAWEAKGGPWAQGVPGARGFDPRPRAPPWRGPRLPTPHPKMVLQGAFDPHLLTPKQKRPKPERSPGLGGEFPQRPRGGPPRAGPQMPHRLNHRPGRRRPAREGTVPPARRARRRRPAWEGKGARARGVRRLPGGFFCPPPLSTLGRPPPHQASPPDGP